MKKLKISFFLIFVVAFFATSQSNAQVVHDEWVFDVECADGLWVFCLEEPVVGHVVYNVIYRYDKEGNFKGAHFNVKGGKFTGCETGTVYKVMDSGNEVWHLNKNNEQEVWHLNEKLQFIGKKGQKYIMTWKGHFVMNANGEVKLDKWEFVDCD